MVNTVQIALQKGISSASYLRLCWGLTQQVLQATILQQSTPNPLPLGFLKGMTWRWMQLSKVAHCSGWTLFFLCPGPIHAFLNDDPAGARAPSVAVDFQYHFTQTQAPDTGEPCNMHPPGVTVMQMTDPGALSMIPWHFQVWACKVLLSSQPAPACRHFHNSQTGGAWMTT